MNWRMILIAMAVNFILSLLGCIVRKEKARNAIIFILASTIFVGCVFVFLDRLLMLKLIVVE